MYALTPFERDLMNLFGFDENKHDKPVSAVSFRSDIKENKDSFVIEAELPGFDKSEIAVDITGKALVIKAEHKEEKSDKNDGYILRERSSSSYKRSFNLAAISSDVAAIDTENIKAGYQNGILCITLPKKQPEIPSARRLQID